MVCAYSVFAMLVYLTVTMLRMVTMAMLCCVCGVSADSSSYCDYIRSSYHDNSSVHAILKTYQVSQFLQYMFGLTDGPPYQVLICIIFAEFALCDQN